MLVKRYGNLLLSLMIGLSVLAGCSVDSGSTGGGSAGDDSTAPTVNITSPLTGGSIGLNSIIEVDASDNVAVDHVEFYVDGTLYHTSHAAPWQYGLDSGSLSGTVPLKAIAYDAEGNSATDDDTSVTVDNILPTAGITSPADLDVVSGSITVNATASDADSGIERVELYVDGFLKDTDSTSPYDFTLDTATVSDGARVIMVRSYDNAGNTETSSITVTVDNTAPSAALTDPVDGDYVKGSVYIAANAGDATSGIEKVEFYVGGALVYTDTTAPYGYTWDSTGINATRTIDACAFDNAGNQADATTLTVTVDNTDPAVSFTAPTPDGTADVRGTVTIAADPSDTNGIDKVEFYVGGTLRSTKTSAPWQYTLNTGGYADGGYSVEARAYDFAGNFDSVSRSLDFDNTNPSANVTYPSSVSTIDGSSGTIILAASASDNRGVTGVEFFIDSISVDTDTTAPYTCDWASSTGTHSIKVIATDEAGNTWTDNDTTFYVDVAAPSSVSINAPADNDHVSASVTLRADATDAESGVDRVDFYVDGSIYAGTGIHTSGDTWELDWDSTSVADGSRAIEARAYDLVGLITVSASINVTVDNTLPTGVNVTAPAPGAFLGGSVDIDAAATGADGVKFYVDGTEMADDTLAPFSYTWDTSSSGDGVHAIKIIAYDSAGNQVEDNDTTVTVDNTAPTLTVVSPSNNSYKKGTVTISTTASDNDAVDHVDFDIDGGGADYTANSFPWEISWDTTGYTDGTAYSIVITVYDRAGNSFSDSTSLDNVTVDNVAPTVDITVPSDLDHVRQTVSVTAISADVDSAVSKVEFYVDNVKKGTDVSATFAYSWDSTGYADGAHTLKAVSYDAAGNIATDNDTSVTVDNTTPVGTISINNGDTWVNGTGVTITNSITDTYLSQMRFGNSIAERDAASWEPYDAGPMAWTLSTGDGVKTVYAQFRDQAGNVLSVNDEITLDETVPDVGAGSDAHHNAVFPLSGIANDATSGIAAIAWTDTHSGTGGGTVTFSDSSSLTSQFSADADGTYILQLSVTDNAGNNNTDTVTITWDTTVPTGTISINSSDAFTAATAVTITNSITDTNLFQMRFGNSIAERDAASWEDYAGTKDLTISTGDGVKTVYAQFRDQAGNVLSVTDDITLDATDPTGTISIDEGNYTNSTGINITNDITDANLYQMRFSNDGGGTWPVGWVPYDAGPYAWTLSTGDGLKTVTAEFIDDAGNVFQTTDTITLDQTAPSVDITVPVADTTVSGAVTITASASDATSGINRVEFFVDGVLVNTDTLTDYEYSWDTSALGNGTTHVLRADAYDNAGNLLTGNDITVTVNRATVVDSSETVGGHTSIAYSGSNIYISYYDTGGNLMFADYNGSDWNKRTVDSTDDVGQYTSLAVDGTNIYISYYDATNGNLKFATAVTSALSSWTITEVDNSASDVGQYTSIAYSGSNIYISYYDSSNTAIMFVYYNGSAWSTPVTVDSTGVGQYTSLAVYNDGSDNAFISYYDASGYLKFATADDSDWSSWGTITQVDGTSDNGQYTSIGVYYDGSNVNAFISYHDVTSGALNFAYASDLNWAAAGWTLQEVDATGTTGLDSAIDLYHDGSNLNAYISYYDSTNGYLRFATADDSDSWGTWTTATVDESAGQHGDIAVSGSNVYMSYLDSTHGYLMFIKSSDGGATW